MKRALVTGAAGFIGSHLCERLLAENYRVYGLDCFTPHYARWLKERNLAYALSSPDFTFHERDVAVVDLDDIVAESDVVFHLAARPGVRDSWTDFDDYVHSNVVGTKRLLDACVGRQLKVVLASSSSVYGNASVLPVKEEAPLQPISPYGASKVTTEVTGSAYSRSHGLEVVSLRYFTVYGPRQRPDMGISRFIAAATAGQEITIFGDGCQQRDMTYVGDAVDATIAAVEFGEPGAVYNIASGDPKPLLHVLDALAKTLEIDLKLHHIEAQLGDVRDTWADISLARETLHYEPSTTLKVGLAEQASNAKKRRRTDQAAISMT